MSHGPPRAFQPLGYATPIQHQGHHRRSVLNHPGFQTMSAVTSASSHASPAMSTAGYPPGVSAAAVAAAAAAASGGNSSNTANGQGEPSRTGNDLLPPGSSDTVYCQRCQTIRHISYFHDERGGFDYNMCNLCKSRKLQKQKYQAERYNDAYKEEHKIYKEPQAAAYTQTSNQHQRQQQRPYAPTQPMHAISPNPLQTHLQMPAPLRLPPHYHPQQQQQQQRPSPQSISSPQINQPPPALSSASAMASTNQQQQQAQDQQLNKPPGHFSTAAIQNSQAHLDPQLQVHNVQRVAQPPLPLPLSLPLQQQQQTYPQQHRVQEPSPYPLQPLPSVTAPSNVPTSSALHHMRQISPLPHMQQQQQQVPTSSSVRPISVLPDLTLVQTTTNNDATPTTTSKESKEHITNNNVNSNRATRSNSSNQYDDKTTSQAILSPNNFVLALQQESEFDRKQYVVDIQPLITELGKDAGFTQIGRAICDLILTGTKFNFSMKDRRRSTKAPDTLSTLRYYCSQRADTAKPRKGGGDSSKTVNRYDCAGALTIIIDLEKKTGHVTLIHKHPHPPFVPHHHHHHQQASSSSNADRSRQQQQQVEKQFEVLRQKVAEFGRLLESQQALKNKDFIQTATEAFMDAERMLTACRWMEEKSAEQQPPLNKYTLHYNKRG